MMNNRCRALCAIALLSQTAPVAAQYRPGEPPTLPKPAPAPDIGGQALAGFSSAYKRAGSPRIVVFWNRHFDDEVSSRYKEVTDYEEVNDGSGHITSRRSVGDERTTTKRKSNLAEPIEWELEGAFVETMTNAGVRLVDRASIMRAQGEADGAQERANVQAIETRAITGKADIVVEILRADDPRSSAGIIFRIVARDIRNARILASFTTSGRPQTPRMGLVAGTDGFVRATPPAPGPDDVGRQLAVELARNLGSAL